jgi:hypothetical protein
MPASRLTVLRAIDKLDKFGVEGVKLLLGAGRWDGGKEGEGDFTPGAGLDDIDIESLVQFVWRIFVPRVTVPSLMMIERCTKAVSDEMPELTSSNLLTAFKMGTIGESSNISTRH